MKKLLFLGVILFFALAAFDPASGREVARPTVRPAKDWAPEQFAGQPGLEPEPLMEAAVDTYNIVRYTFDNHDWQGWTRVDRTGQVDTFFHVDDFAGLGGGDFGGLVPIEGLKSMWCGARPNPTDPYLCSWKKAPGYGNAWNQWLVSDPIYFTGLLTLSYHGRFDSEPKYDYTYVEYDGGNGNWQEVVSYDGHQDVVAVHHLGLASTATKLRFHFESDGAWSDQDGLWNTDGACIIDSIGVADSGGLLNYEDFEGAPVGALDAGIWHGRPWPGYGTYSGLRSNLADKDPCGENLSAQVVFFIGSTVPSSDYPGLYVTPFCTGATTHDWPCQAEWVVSPPIDLTKYSTANDENQDTDIPAGELPALGGTMLYFTVYRDLPLPNLVFYQWYVRAVSSGCPGGWRSHDIVWYGDDQMYYYQRADVSSYIGSSEAMYVSLGVIDMCDVWYLMNGDCAEHSPSPWFDNVRVQKYKTDGPQWYYRDADLFQDNFPVEEAPPWGTVRADAANDIRYGGSAVVDPGDSITVDCSSGLGGGIDTMPNGYPAVYMHVNARWIGAGAPPLGDVIHGVQLQGTYGLWMSTDAGSWDIIQGDYARTAAGVVGGRYMFDLNDSLFVPGYMIEYYFTAVDNAGIEKALPKWARSTGPYFEFTCLPTGASDILFVDDFSGRGSFAGVVENYWNTVFRAVLPPDNQPDRYDVNAPTSGVSNGPGSRANAALMRYQYYDVVWDSGDLQNITISDGTTQSDKSNDCQLFIDWMNLAEHHCGLWICGDDVAYDLTLIDQSPAALTLMSTWCGVSLANMSYFDATGGRAGGGVVYPLVTGDPDGIFYHGGLPDQFYVDGGCWTFNMFDCLDTINGAQHALDYPDYAGGKYYAGIQCSRPNSHDQAVRTMWFGFSLMYMRDDREGAPIDRFEIARDVFNYMDSYTNVDYTGTETPKVNALAQNYPNPFNPVTTIKFDVKEKGLVTVKVYNVAGQLVRTLVNEVKPAGSYTAPWDGTNNLGADVASGIYFYKMATAGFSATRKMVLLR
jgi:hypothetical protein